MAFRWFFSLVLLAGCTVADEDSPAAEGSSDTSSGGEQPEASTSTALPEADSSSGETGVVAECTEATVDIDCPVEGVKYGCVAASCVEGACSYEGLPDGTSCSYERDNGTCHNGTCWYECQEDEDCNAYACESNTCDRNRCIYDALDQVPAADDDQTDGDCSVVYCVEGQPEEQEDLDDPEDDRDPCTIGTCVEGETVQELAPEGTRCSESGTCDATGLCVSPA